jgi:SPX domain protein involved in polyphosphate accumulation
MKFAKELEENLVAEWKEKYLDYKGGKKKLKAVSRAVRNADKPASHAWPRAQTPVPTA